MKSDYESLPGVVSQTLDYGLKIILLEEKRIVVFITSGDLSREAIDYWWETFQNIVESWPVDDSILLLFDLTHPKVTLTPYLRHLGLQTRKLLIQDGRFVRSAAIITDSFNMRLASMISRQFSRGTKQYHERIFHSHETALTWLQQFLKCAS